jgi:17beta-estradiol 17-dehydrogenase / very-long-chain 3-oxoacyl-CoA reductase
MSFYFTVIGFVTTIGFAIYIFYKAVRFYDIYFLVTQHPLQKYKLNPTSGSHADGRKKNKAIAWALVTGSSAGIGYGFADYLLSCGFGVIIVANQGIGDAVAALEKSHPDGNIAAYNFDCMEATISDIEELVQDISDHPITILINNVGATPIPEPIFRPFHHFEPQGIDDTIDLNARFMTHLTRLMMPILKKSANPGSLILNVSSGARFGIPYLSLYSATKAYVSSFSHTISRECKAFQSPIDCLLIVPGDVRTPANHAGLPKGTPLAGEYAKIVLDRVDKAVARGMLEISPFWKHAVETTLMSSLPEHMLLSTMVKIAEGKRDAFAKAQ